MELIKIDNPILHIHNPYSKEREAYTTIDGICVLKSVDKPKDKWGWLIHVSISRKDRLPSWEEVRAVKDRFFGDKAAMMVIPSKKYYVNIHNYCFHLHETPEDWDLM